ncbi:Transmembrane protein [Pseudohyphozyma bogoriensis]|nr:Transmembrane protein [Pseudohyphozyma bogoriensis]
MREMMQPVSTVYSEEFWRPLTTAVYLVSLMALATMLSRRMPSWKDIRRWNVPAAKVALVATLMDSTIYVFTQALLVLGVGTSFSGALTKVFITWFLIERVHIVHSKGMRRRDSWLYRANLCLMSGWIVVWCLFVKYHGAWMRPDGVCVVMLANIGTYFGFAVDIAIDLYLSLLFAIPLYRGEWSNPALRWLAIKSILCTALGMTSTATNALITGSDQRENQQQPAHTIERVTLPRKSVHYSVEVTSITEVDESAVETPASSRRGSRRIDVVLASPSLSEVGAPFGQGPVGEEKKDSPFQDRDKGISITV